MVLILASATRPHPSTTRPCRAFVALAFGSAGGEHPLRCRGVPGEVRRALRDLGIPGGA
jgi:hypothetical protein